jgi:very-short-patch-repair endonuclease
MPKAPSILEETLLLQIRGVKLPIPHREYRFAAMHVGLGTGIKERLQRNDLKDWKFDFAYPELKFAIECEGGLYSDGRHTRGKGYEDDMEKYNAALMLGWRVYRCSTRLINNLVAVQQIKLLFHVFQK